MVIIIGNEKGGTGKTTMALLAAKFLAAEKNYRVAVVDMEYQQSLTRRSAHNRLLENLDPFQVISTTPEQYPILFEGLLAQRTEMILIDLPARLQDDDLLAVFRTANVAVCPFTYDQESFFAAVFFAVFARSINEETEIIFVPNRVKKTHNPLRREIDGQLYQFGTLSADIPENISFQRISSFFIPASVEKLVRPALENLYQSFLAAGQEADDE